MTATEKRADNAKMVAVLVLLIAIAIAVSFTLWQRSEWRCREGRPPYCISEYTNEEKPWYIHHPWAVPLIIIPAGGVLGWFIGVSVPVEPDPPQAPAQPHTPAFSGPLVCDACGRPLAADDRFCAQCGHAVE